MRTPLLLWLAIGASGVSACGDDPSRWEPGRPRIDALRFLQQSPQDPYGLLFSIDFTDSDGDLGSGAVHLRVGEQEAAMLDIADLFQRQTPPIALDATSGELDVVVKLESNVTTAQRIQIGFRLEDARGHESNEPFVVVRAFESTGLGRAVSGCLARGY